MEEYIGTIKMFAGGYAPLHWEFCNGQQLDVQRNAPLYQVIGNRFGGDERTFTLPDFRGRMPVGAFADQSDPIALGKKAGQESFQLRLDQMPDHKHEVRIDPRSYADATIEIPVHTSPGNEDTEKPEGGILTDTGVLNYTSSPANDIYGGEPIPFEIKLEIDGANAQTLETGKNEPIDWKIPRLGIHFIICTFGLFPPS
jgi:microcystin-dependent protein